MRDQQPSQEVSQPAEAVAEAADTDRGYYRLPHQLDTLVLYAAASEEFADFLCAERARIVARASSGLDPTEREILGSASPAALQLLIAQVRQRLASAARRRFCTQAAVALASFLAGGALLTGASCAPRRAPHRPRARPRPAPPARKPGPVPTPYYPTPEGENLTGCVRSVRPAWAPEWRAPPVPPRRRP